jgi:mono/diheme cytochrome c family protein
MATFPIKCLWRAAIAGHVVLSAAAGFAAADASFAERVKPIFERHCVSCHSGERPKGGLDLTVAGKALAGGESGPLLTAGKPDESPLLDYISGDEPAMPKDAPPLKADEIEAIRAWISSGAAWPADIVLSDRKQIDANWWSLLPWQKVAVPPQNDTWIRTPIDAFVLAKLREQKLAPSAEADRQTLIRRLTYDLHGLPPTPLEVADFLADASDRAYENLVDRLLASPRYGERWARHWLDVVHYGETHGYDKDKTRPNAWPYRDYVIRSLNADKPYDRFVAEQLAGDALDPADPDAVVATGFIAAGPWDFVGHVELREGTTDKEIARSNDRDDMLAATMSTFMSLTVHCARCHNHKFDPITQRDYYALQAVFAGVDRSDRPYDAEPEVARRRVELTSELRRWEQAVASVQAELAALKNAQLKTIDERLRGKTAELENLPQGETSQTLGYHSQIMSRADVSKWVQIDLGASLALDEVVVVPAHVEYGGHPGPGFGFPPRYRVEVSDDPEFVTASTITDLTAVDVPHPGDRWQRHTATGTRGRYVRITATKLWERTSDWIFAIGELVVLADGKNAALNRPVTALDSIEAAPSWAKTNLVDGFSSRERVATAEGLEQRRQDLEAAINGLQRERKQLAFGLLNEPARETLLAAEARLPEIQRELASLPEQQRVYATTHNFTPRPIHLLARGDVNNRGELIEPAGVACVAGPQATFNLENLDAEAERRAALARWLTDPRNALLRRSIVNRVWQYHFGRGIVDSPNDFGRKGSLPTHPELLEWLATWFADHGHSLKELHRLIVTSAVYRQSSQSNPAFEAIDGGNQYLWRMNRGRLDAESIRDTLLFVSGKLDLTMGGPSVQQFFFKDDHSPIYDYTQFDVDDPRSMRRSIYRFLVRSVPDPLMDCLDCADPSILTPRRNATLTSVQALALLNNPLVVRQAEHFAARLQSLHSELPAQIEAACRLALGRTPTDVEASTLVAHAEKHGLSSACRVLFNSNAFLFID